MRREAGLIAACLLGGLMVTVLVGGLQGPVRAEVAARAAAPGDVVINEVAWAGHASFTSDEWIELYNTTASTISLDGWQLVDDDNLDIALSGDISPYGYYLIERTDDNTVSDITADWVGSFGSGLSNGGEVLTLTDDLNGVIDTGNVENGGSWPAGSDSSYYSMERKNPNASDIDANWCSNDGITINGQDAGGNPINGTPKAQNSCYQGVVAGEADLVVVKTGPVTAERGSVITYCITISNTGGTTATDTLVTDTLPSAVDFVTQTSSFAFSRPGGALLWEVGDVLTDTQHLVTVTARVTDTAVGLLVNCVSATTAASETVMANNSDSWTTGVGESQVLISAVLYDGYQSGEPDEAVQLINVGVATAELAGWRIDDDLADTSYAEFVSGTLRPGERIWVARKATSFTLSFGFSPDYEVEDTDPLISDLTGTWPKYPNPGDEVVLRDGEGVVVDVLVYVGGSSATGWSGPAVQPYSAGRTEGQILYRIPDETTGLPGVDTDTASDWIQYTGNVTYGRRVMYPGWDFDSLFWPMTATEPATIVVGIAPDNAFDVISQTIARAQHAISVEVYSLRHPEIITALVQKAQEGVSVTVLLEGQQALVGVDDERWQQELWACQEIEVAGGQCWFMIHDTGKDIFNRYDYLHAKFIVVDGEWVLITSQNLTISGFPSDDKSNGTYGSRGVVLATDAPSVVARASQVFALDLDPAHHNDLVRWNTAAYSNKYGPPAITYTPQITVSDYTTSAVSFSATFAVGGTFDFELFTAPEAALRRSDALLGLVARAGAGDEVYVEQMYEYVDWGNNPVDDPNLRLEAYIAAARRGAKVRILLNKGTFGHPYASTPNTATVAYVNQLARDEGLDLEAALCDPTFYGIHNKMVLVWLHGEGGYVHVGSINGSEGSSKVNRELALQVRSDEVYDYLMRVFEVDWRWAHPVFLPLVMANYTPPIGYIVVSEVMYRPSGQSSGNREWVELYNPTGRAIDISSWYLGDAVGQEYGAGRYRFPDGTVLPAHGVIVVAQQAEDFQGVSGFSKPHFEFLIDPYRDDPAVPNMVADGSWDGFGLALGDAGDKVVLRNAGEQDVDVVVYGMTSYGGVISHPGGVESNWSLERRPPYHDTDDCSVDFVPRYPATPGSVPE